MTTEIKILCDKDDPNINAIAARMAMLRRALKEDSLVAIACKDSLQHKDAVLLAVMTVEEGSKLAKYAPIAQLYYPDDDGFTRFTPPASATVIEEDDKKVVSG